MHTCSFVVSTMSRFYQPLSYVYRPFIVRLSYVYRALIVVFPASIACRATIISWRQGSMTRLPRLAPWVVSSKHSEHEIICDSFIKRALRVWGCSHIGTSVVEGRVDSFYFVGICLMDMKKWCSFTRTPNGPLMVPCAIPLGPVVPIQMV